MRFLKITNKTLLFIALFTAATFQPQQSRCQSLPKVPKNHFFMQIRGKYGTQTTKIFQFK